MRLVHSCTQVDAASVAAGRGDSISDPNLPMQSAKHVKSAFVVMDIILVMSALSLCVCVCVLFKSCFIR